MRQYSTGLARRATGDAIDPQVPGLDPATAAPSQEGVAALHGVMTGLANLVNEQLGRLTIGPRATRFLRHLERVTFGNAGWHRRAGRDDPGLWCPYDHAAWAETLGLSSSALTHLRSRLVKAGIIWYTPGPDYRGQGALGWSFDFASWTSPQWGGARAGAGRPRASPSSEHRSKAAPRGRGGCVAVLPGATAEPAGTTTARWKARLSTASEGTGTTAISGCEPVIQDVNAGGTADAQS
ncbi:MAG TPA: hypothetical protein VKC57_18525, partial [Ktedonobacterales bacterium]|nr:hypothetical protein [Ktedonobacterales bacterium]